MVKVSATLACQEIMAERKKKNLKVYDFGLGANPVKQPQFFVDAISKYAHLKHYTTAKGIPELATTLKKQYSTNTYQVSNILVGNGLKELLYIIQLSFDGIIYHITPSWVSYKEQIKVANKLPNLVEIEASIENNFKITKEQLETNLQKYQDKNKMIIFNNPNNPTGILYTPEEVKELAEICNKYNTVVMADEIYMNISHFNPFQTIADFIPHLTIRGSSVSKDLACGGYRLGWLTFPKELNELYDISLSNAVSIYSCTCTPIQYATNDILNTDLTEFFNYQNNLFKQITETSCGILSKSEIKFVKPTSAWYVFLNFDNYTEKLNKKDIITSQDLSMYLINNIGIVAVPGESFNVPGLNLRLSFVDTIDNIKEGLTQLVELVNNL